MRRLIAHPVMGWYAIILLATMVTIAPVYLLVSKSAAQWVSFGGMLIASLWLMANLIRDLHKTFTWTNRNR